MTFDSREEYVTAFQDAIEDVAAALRNLSELWYDDEDYGLDMNEYAADSYPFDKDLNELATDVELWVDDFHTNIINEYPEFWDDPDFDIDDYDDEE